MRGLRLPDGRGRLVRHGHGPERLVRTGVGPVPVRRARPRDRGVRDRGAGPDGERIRLASSILPRWARRTPSLDAPLPILPLRGVPMGDLREALAALLGRDAPNPPPAAVARPRDGWRAGHARRQRRGPPARHHAHLRADGVCLQARMEPRAGRMPVPTGAAPEGRKGPVGLQVGVRGSAQGWRELPVGPEARGLAVAPGLATGDGAPGFRRALEAAFPGTRHRRCRVHRASDVPDRPPRSVRPAAKRDLREIWRAPDRAAAGTAVTTLAEECAAKHGKAVARLPKERDALLALHDLPAGHRGHPRTSNPIGGVLATVRHRPVRAEGALSRDTGGLMVLRLVMTAARTRRRPKGEGRSPKVAQGARSRNGVEVTDTPKQTAA
jgi:putative transposase